MGENIKVNRLLLLEWIHLHVFTPFLQRGKLFNDLRAQGFCFFFMLNSAEHESLKAHIFKNIKKFSIFKVQINLEF